MQASMYPFGRSSCFLAALLLLFAATTHLDANAEPVSGLASIDEDDLESELWDTSGVCLATHLLQYGWTLGTAAHSGVSAIATDITSGANTNESAHSIIAQRTDRRMSKQGIDTEVVQLIYSSDKNGFAGLLPSMLSAAKHLSKPGSSVFNLIVPEDEVDLTKDLVACFKEQLADMSDVPRVRILPMMPPPVDVEENPFQPRLGGMAQTWARFDLPRYLPDVPKVIWIDIDTLVEGDLRELYNMPMRHSVAARRQDVDTIDSLYIQDSLNKSKNKSTPPGELLEALSKNQSAKSLLVFNAGVLVIDLDRWRTEETTKSLVSLTNSLPYPDDQFVLNIKFQVQGSFDELDWKWNYFNLAWGKGRKDPFMYVAWILHFSGPDKPYEDFASEAASNSTSWALYQPHLPKAKTDGSLSMCTKFLPPVK